MGERASSHSEAGQLEGALVTIDAIGCQVGIADKIVEHKADYLLPLKGNQATLETDVEDYFRTAPADAGSRIGARLDAAMSFLDGGFGDGFGDFAERVDHPPRLARVIKLRK